MDEIAPEYDVVVLGTGMLLPRHPPQTSITDQFLFRFDRVCFVWVGL